MPTGKPINKNRYTQCLLLVPPERDTNADESSSSSSTGSAASSKSCPKSGQQAYALLPDVFVKEYPGIVESFHKHHIEILLNTSESLSSVEDPRLELVEIFVMDSSVVIVNGGNTADEGVAAPIIADFASRTLIKNLLGSAQEVRLTLREGMESVRPAIDNSNAKVIERFLTHRANVKLKGCDFRGRTLLHAAARLGLLDLVRFMCDKGADLNVVNELSIKTPLLESVKGGHLPIVRFLLSRGASVDAKDSLGQTPLLSAIDYNSDPKIIEALLQNGADPNVLRAIEPVCIFSPLSSAIGRGSNINIVKVLLKYGACADFKEKNGEYTVAYCFQTMRPSLLEYLLDSCFSDWKSLRETSLHERIPSGSRCHFRVNHRKAIETLERHLLKLHALNLDPDMSFSGDLLNVSWSKGRPEEFKAQCEAEVRRMKAMHVGSAHLSIYDFLTKDEFALARLLNSTCQMPSLTTLQQSFPIYFNILRCRIEKGNERKNKTEECMKFFSSLCSHFKELPRELREKILNYCTMRDLLVFKHVCSQSSSGSG